MSEDISNNEDYPSAIEAMNERVLERLTRVGAAMEVDLVNEYGVLVRNKVDEDGNIEWSSFSSVLNVLSLRPEAFFQWNDDYFDEQFDEVVRIARKRGNLD